MPLVVIGLGNPGRPYKGNRHNAGFFVVDLLAEKLSIKLTKPFFYSYTKGKGVYRNKAIVLAKPLTYMNRSGLAIPGILHYAKADTSELLVVCDNLDLEPGICRLKTKGSSAGHRGLASVIEYTGTGDFMRLYIGIGRPPDNNIIEHVLSNPGGEEKQRIDLAVDKAASGILLLLEKPPLEVMNFINVTAIEQEEKEH
ncbi:MAG: aminoacyl-tRNA hydrolase [Spirochaetales bacterium]|nr:aminoacyl-tRNA hydrolase [Spirochaetales bacterium]